MARSQNPVEAFRREQKKKELKKNQQQRQKEKQAKLHELDVDEIRERLKKLERQVQQNPADGPTRKRKQELEDTLQAALKKQKAMEDEEKEKEAAAAPKATLADLNAANRERYQNPENSIYYHPVLNPFGAPPPGRPQMYRVPPPKPAAPPQATGPQTTHHKQQRSYGGIQTPPPPPGSQVRRVGPMKPQRPGKRPPLPAGPPPPETIEVPTRPPLPSSVSGGAVGHPPPPPPPPPTNTRPTNAVVPPPPPPALPQVVAPPPPPVSSSPRPALEDIDMDGSGIVGVYPPPEESASETIDDAYSEEHDSRQQGIQVDEDNCDEDRFEQQQRLRSLVPTTLRVQRVAKPKTLPTAVPRPLPQPPGSLHVLSAPAAPAREEKTTDPSVTEDFDAFMEEMKSLGAV